ncbi:MAG: hypothetical protein M3N26_07755 [Pseudomonadota bacterium]|nr:hypothetical protein [Pseudomonadota bacterium]
MRRITPFLAVALIVLPLGAAGAQDAVAPTPKPARRMKLDSVCAASLERFCPALAATPGQTRNQVICLKPYRSSLPLSCRSAVATAVR